LTSLTTLLAIMRYMGRPKSAAVRDVDIAGIVSILAKAISTHL